MDTRDSLHDAVVRSTAANDLGVSDMSDYEAVDQTPNVIFRILRFLFSLWWVAAIIIGLLVLVLPNMFPQWGEDNKTEIDKIKDALNSSAVLSEATKFKWGAILNKAAWREFAYAGTGLHPVLRRNPALKEKWFYTGEILMMKTYVSDYDMASKKERAEWNRKGGLKFPAVGVEQTEAADYCASLGAGHRLPSYNELVVASTVFATRNKLKPNLNLVLFESKALWTSTGEHSDSWFSWLAPSSDNFRVFTPGQDAEIYKDDGYDSADLGFLCVREVK